MGAIGVGAIGVGDVVLVEARTGAVLAGYRAEGVPAILPHSQGQPPWSLFLRGSGLGGLETWLRLDGAEVWLSWAGLWLLLTWAGLD